MVTKLYWGGGGGGQIFDIRGEGKRKGARWEGMEGQRRKWESIEGKIQEGGSSVK